MRCRHDGVQANGTAFHSPEELLKRVGLYDLTQKSMHLQLAVCGAPAPPAAPAPLHCTCSHVGPGGWTGQRFAAGWQRLMLQRLHATLSVESFRPHRTPRPHLLA